MWAISIDKDRFDLLLRLYVAYDSNSILFYIDTFSVNKVNKMGLNGATFFVQIGIREYGDTEFACIPWKGPLASRNSLVSPLPRFSVLIPARFIHRACATPINVPRSNFARFVGLWFGCIEVGSYLEYLRSHFRYLLLKK